MQLAHIYYTQKLPRLTSREFLVIDYSLDSSDDRFHH